jgi:Tol biopolymer transport system component
MPAIISFGREPGPLVGELSRLNSDTALIVPSQGVDEFPLWSPDGRYLAANIEGKWFKIDLNHILLKEGSWRGNHKIGVIDSKSSLSGATEEEVEKWRASSKVSPRKSKTVAGTTIELRQSGLGVSLIITKKAEKSVTLWTTDMENCHSLVLSPDQKFVAFISELNGVVVFQLS